MSTERYGGPAFARPCSEDRASGDQHDGNRTIDGQEGMSLLDYFAARAPATPTFEFTINMPMPRPAPDWGDAENRRRGGDCLNINQIEAWDEERKQRSAIEWPWVWAEQMLKERQRRYGPKRGT